MISYDEGEDVGPENLLGLTLVAWEPLSGRFYGTNISVSCPSRQIGADKIDQKELFSV